MKSLRFFTGVLLILFAQNTRAQIPTPQSAFVKLKIGKIITGNHVETKDRVFAASTVTIDSTTFKSREIEFYGDGYGHLYGRFGGGLMEPVFWNAPKDIYIFKAISTNYTPTYNANGFSTGGYYSSKVSYGYTVGITGIQGITLDNVSRDMSRDSVALAYILKAKTERRGARISLVFAGAGLVMIYSSLFNAGTPGSAQLVLGGTVVMLGGSISAAIFSGKKRKDTRRAVSAYTGYNF